MCQNSPDCFAYQDVLTDWLCRRTIFLIFSCFNLLVHKSLITFTCKNVLWKGAFTNIIIIIPQWEAQIPQESENPFNKRYLSLNKRFPSPVIVGTDPAARTVLITKAISCFESLLIQDNVISGKRKYYFHINNGIRILFVFTIKKILKLHIDVTINISTGLSTNIWILYQDHNLLVLIITIIKVIDSRIALFPQISLYSRDKKYDLRH